MKARSAQSPWERRMRPRPQPTCSRQHLSQRIARMRLAAARSASYQLDVDSRFTVWGALGVDRGQQESGARLADRRGVVRDRGQRWLEQRREVEVVETGEGKGIRD